MARRKALQTELGGVPEQTAGSWGEERRRGTLPVPPELAFFFPLWVLNSALPPFSPIPDYLLNNLNLGA